MQYCENCGTQLNDNATACHNCGTPVRTAAPTAPVQTQTPAVRIVAKVFMIIGCIISAFELLIPLCWTIPMTVHYCRAVRENRPVGVGFKVCSMLFVSLVGGICMLCDNN